MIRGQRDPVPFNRRGGRAGRGGRDASGGAPPALYRRTLAPGMDGEESRYPGVANDTLIRRNHTAWYPVDTYVPAGNGWVDWTAAGPVRPELHMRHADYRLMQGNSQTAALLSPVRGQTTWAPGYRTTDQGQIIQPRVRVRVGLHSDPKAAAKATVARYTNANPKMRTARQDRLRPGQYTGQSYSQTTRLQGGG